MKVTSVVYCIHPWGVRPIWLAQLQTVLKDEGVLLYTPSVPLSEYLQIEGFEEHLSAQGCGAALHHEVREALKIGSFASFSNEKEFFLYSDGLSVRERQFSDFVMQISSLVALDMTDTSVNSGLELVQAKTCGKIVVGLNDHATVPSPNVLRFLDCIWYNSDVAALKDFIIRQTASWHSDGGPETAPQPKQEAQPTQGITLDFVENVLSSSSGARRA